MFGRAQTTGARPGPAGYSRKKRRSQQRAASLSYLGRDIGAPPAVADPARREAASKSLRLYSESYFPQRFPLAWSPDHLSALARIEGATCDGGLYALAMPRGSGKTTIAEVACLWATMTGRHPFVMLLAVSAAKAAELLANIKVELLTNDLLFADWPEICHPIRALEDRANRAKGQHIGGRKTFVGWRKSEVVLPTVAGSTASGAILRVAGLTGGGIRGAKATRPGDGASVRPSLVILDDPQDNASARSPYQCENRHRLIHGGVLGMAGPGQRVTAVCLCTVIEPADLADQLLDREKSPLWTGERFQLLKHFPARMDLWEQYAIQRADEFRNDGDGTLATEWYGRQRAEMDAGALAAWPERHNPEELSAVQHAMNLYFLDSAAFWAEYQNAPKAKELGDGQVQQLKADAIAKRTNGLERAAVPLAATRLTAFVDVQQKLLYWLVAAWADNFTGAIIDYGTYPDQGRAYFTLADARQTLARACPGAGVEASIHAGLGKTAELLLTREWQREDGTALKVERLLVDANWSTDTVYTWCRTSPHAALVLPSHGRAVEAKDKPWSEYTAKPGERLGTHWLITTQAGKRATRHARLDVNYWKTFVAERLLTAPGDAGALLLAGKAGADHRLLAAHLAAEWRERTQGRGRVVDHWELRPERPDNHWWDCLVGCAAAASIQGAKLLGQEQAQRRQRVRWSEVQRRKQQERRAAR